jgi:hypothetical protein
MPAATVVTDVAGVLLSEPCAVRAAIALNAYLHVSRRNGQVPDEGSARLLLSSLPVSRGPR